MVISILDVWVRFYRNTRESMAKSALESGSSKARLIVGPEDEWKMPGSPKRGGNLRGGNIMCIKMGNERVWNTVSVQGGGK